MNIFLKMINPLTIKIIKIFRIRLRLKAENLSRKISIYLV